MTEWTLQEFLTLARTAAESAGAMLTERPAELFVESKSSPTDAVTQMDRRCEEFLVATLLGARPDDGVLGEEGASRQGTSEYRWVIDPIDGTVNYMYDLPGWAVCVGLEKLGEPVVGVVAIPSIGMTYFGAIGSGSYRVGADGHARRLAVGSVTELSMALTGTGFGYAVSRRMQQSTVAATMLTTVRDLRRMGSAAADICFVASGQLDAYYERGLNPWDYTAAAVIAREAGAIVAGIDSPNPNAALTIATNPKLFPAFHDALKAAEAHGPDVVIDS